MANEFWEVAEKIAAPLGAGLAGGLAWAWRRYRTPTVSRPNERTEMIVSGAVIDTSSVARNTDALNRVANCLDDQRIDRGEIARRVGEIGGDQRAVVEHLRDIRNVVERILRQVETLVHHVTRREP